MEKNGTTTITIGHHPRVSVLDILKLITSSFTGVAPLLLNTFHSPRVALAIEGTAVGLQEASAILASINEMHAQFADSATARMQEPVQAIRPAQMNGPAQIAAPENTAPETTAPEKSVPVVVVEGLQTEAVTLIPQQTDGIVQDTPGFHLPLKS